MSPRGAPVTLHNAAVAEQGARGPGRRVLRDLTLGGSGQWITIRRKELPEELLLGKEPLRARGRARGERLQDLERVAEQLERRLPGLRAVPGHVRVRNREPQDLDDDEVHLRPKVRCVGPRPKVRAPQGEGCGERQGGRGGPARGTRRVRLVRGEGRGVST
jgi:hypothetical protein